MYDDHDHPGSDYWGDEQLPSRPQRPAGSDYWGDDWPGESYGPTFNGNGSNNGGYAPTGGTSDLYSGYDDPTAPSEPGSWGYSGADSWGPSGTGSYGGGPSGTGGYTATRRAGPSWGKIAVSAALILLLILGLAQIPRLLRPSQIAPPTVSLTPPSVVPPTLPPAPSLVPTTPDPATPAPATPAPDPNAPAAELLYYRSRLDPAEQQIYDAIAAAVARQSDKAEGLHLADVDRAFALYDLVMADRPDLFWVDGTSSVSWYDESGGVVADLEFGYSMTQAERQQAQQQLDAIAADLKARLSGRSDYEKVLGVYEYLIDSTAYDLSDMDQSLCAVLLRHRGVCNSYAKATQYLLLQLQVPAIFVGGSAGGEGHAWNIVQIDGDWYQLDTTWGDPVSDDGSQSKTFTYFCLTDEEMYRDHKPDDGWDLPRCTATAANWYRHEGRYLERYDETWIAALLQRDLAAGEEVRFRCADEACYRECCRRLFDEGVAFTLLDAAVGSYAGYNSGTNDMFYDISFAPYY